MTNDIEKVGPSIEQEFQKALEEGLDNGYEELMELFDKTEIEESEDCKACEG